MARAGRLFEHLEQRVGGGVVHVVGGVDDGDAPAAGARGHAEETGELAHDVDRQDRHQLAGVVEAALEHEKAGMRAGHDLQRVGLALGHRQVFGALRGSRHRPACSA
ncbi:MAG: hypothetical protein WDN08_10625 [Rhizomicrobium sp.]